jgi:hypothetical protein
VLLPDNENEKKSPSVFSKPSNWLEFPVSTKIR